MNKTFNIRLQLRTDTEANFKAENPVLLVNELVFVTNITDFEGVGKFKIGNGTDNFNNLPYIEMGGDSADIDLSGYVPTSRTINSKSLANDIELTATDVGALPVGGKAVDSAKADMATTAAGLSATLPISSGGTGQVTASSALSALGGVPTSRTINGYSLSSNITLPLGCNVQMGATQPTNQKSGDLWLKTL